MNEKTNDTICDGCARAVPLEETCTPGSGEWEGATLCNDCYAELADDSDAQL